MEADRTKETRNGEVQRSFQKSWWIYWYFWWGYNYIFPLDLWKFNNLLFTSYNNNWQGSQYYLGFYCPIGYFIWSCYCWTLVKFDLFILKFMSAWLSTWLWWVYPRSFGIEPYSIFTHKLFSCWLSLWLFGYDLWLVISGCTQGFI